MKRLLAVPLRLALGLPAFYGLTVKCRVLQILRNVGVYRGRIDFACMAPVGRIGLTGKAI